VTLKALPCEFTLAELAKACLKVSHCMYGTCCAICRIKRMWDAWAGGRVSDVGKRTILISTKFITEYR